MSEKVIGILKNISELIVATLVEDTPDVVIVKNPAFLGISGQDDKINVNFIPMEMLSLAPPVNIRNLLSNPTDEIFYTFDKKSVIKYDFELAQNVIDNYKTLTNKPATQNTSENVIKLF